MFVYRIASEIVIGTARRSRGPLRNQPCTRWSPSGWSRSSRCAGPSGGAHLLLQVRTQGLNDDLRATFKRWYPGMKADPAPAEEAAA